MSEARGRYDARRGRPGEPWNADRVAALRAALCLSQAELAAVLGVRQQTVSEWETGRYAPRGASARLLGLVAEDAVPYDAPAGAPGGD